MGGAEGGVGVRRWGEAFGEEVVAAAYEGDGADRGVEGEGAEAVVEEVAAGVEGYDHQVLGWRSGVFGETREDGGEVTVLDDGFDVADVAIRGLWFFLRLCGSMLLWWWRTRWGVMERCVRGSLELLVTVDSITVLLLVTQDDLLFGQLSSHIHAASAINVEWLTLKCNNLLLVGSTDKCPP